MVIFAACSPETLAVLKEKLSTLPIIFISKEEAIEHIIKDDFENFAYEKQQNANARDIFFEFSLYEILAENILYPGKYQYEASVWRNKVLDLIDKYRKALLYVESYSLEDVIRDPSKNLEILERALIYYISKKMHWGHIEEVNEKNILGKAYGLSILLLNRMTRAEK